VKSPRLIEAAGNRIWGTYQAQAFCVVRSGNGSPWLLKEIRVRRSRYGASRRASEGENAPRLRGDRESICSAPRHEISAAHRSCGAARFRSRPGAGFLCSGQDGTPWLQLKDIRIRRPNTAPAGERLKAKRPAFTGRSGESICSAPRHEISAAHRSCGGCRFRSRPGAGFCVQGKLRDALVAAEGYPHPTTLIRRQQESVEGKTPRVYGAIRDEPAAPPHEISAAHRSCGASDSGTGTGRLQVSKSKGNWCR
jgi:hypothetical protein